MPWELRSLGNEGGLSSPLLLGPLCTLVSVLGSLFLPSRRLTGYKLPSAPWAPISGICHLTRSFLSPDSKIQGHRNQLVYVNPRLVQVTELRASQARGTLCLQGLAWIAISRLWQHGKMALPSDCSQVVICSSAPFGSPAPYCKFLLMTPRWTRGRGGIPPRSAVVSTGHRQYDAVGSYVYETSRTGKSAETESRVVGAGGCGERACVPNHGGSSRLCLPKYLAPKSAPIQDSPFRNGIAVCVTRSCFCPLSFPLLLPEPASPLGSAFKTSSTSHSFHCYCPHVCHRLSHPHDCLALHFSACPFNLPQAPSPERQERDFFKR